MFGRSSAVATSREGQRPQRSGPEGQHACKLTGRSGRVGSIPEGDELTTAARQDEKTTASRDQPRQSRTDDRAGNGVEDSTAVRRGLNFACFIKEPDDVGRQRQSGAYVL